MIAKYAGKCDLTGTAIVAGQTEIAKFGSATVLAEYANQEAIDNWFASKSAEMEAISNEIAQITGREYSAFAYFSETLNRRRNDRFAILKSNAEWVRSEIAQQQRILETKRNR
jgi:hypothetical protein